jgi:glycosyltransferase involved in cell wall biosynthesis
MINHWPRISIVTPVFNAYSFIETCIQSVLDQNYPNLEHIIIDGGSTDGTAETLQKYSSRLAYWESKPDRGQTHALNKGFARASGEVFAWLNADERYLPGTLKLVAYAAEDLKGQFLIFGNRMFAKAETPDHVIIEAVPNWHPHAFMLYTGRTLFSDASFWSQEAHIATGEIDETRYPHCAMDVDWFIRLSGNISAYRHINRPLSLFLDHPGRATNTAVAAGIRYNERIRHDERKRCGISRSRLIGGWIWYGLRWRLYCHGWNGLFMFPRLSTLLHLIIPSKSKDA